MAVLSSDLGSRTFEKSTHCPRMTAFALVFPFLEARMKQSRIGVKRAQVSECYRRLDDARGLKNREGQRRMSVRVRSERGK